jgi:SAM-dependent methyltransferase
MSSVVAGVAEVSARSASLYDQVCYHGTAVANTAPAHLALCSAWHGGPRPPLDEYRAVELGCGDGANLVALAFYNPGCTFVGVDSSRVEFDRARAAARELGVENVRFIHRDVRELEDELGAFDYAIAHGLYSWVPDDAREAILAFCRRRVAPEGLAYVSYNAQPGWATRRLVRETLLASPAVREAALEDRAWRAMELAARLLEDMPSREYAHAVLLSGELERVRDGKPFYVLHEYLADVNDGFWLGEFVQRARRQGLDYVADAQFCRWEGHVPAELRESLSARGLDAVEREETADLLGNRYFRASILRRDDAPPGMIDRQELMEELYAATSLAAQSDPFDLREGVVERFTGGGGTEVTLDGAVTKAAVVLLSAQWPAGIRMPDLCARASALLAAHGIDAPADGPARLLDDLAELFEAGQADFRLREPAFELTVPANPRAHALARAEAARGDVLTTPYHLPLPFGPEAMALVRGADGSRSLDALRREFGRELVDETVPILARWGLLER